MRAAKHLVSTQAGQNMADGKHVSWPGRRTCLLHSDRAFEPAGTVHQRLRRGGQAVLISVISFCQPHRQERAPSSCTLRLPSSGRCFPEALA